MLGPFIVSWWKAGPFNQKVASHPDITNLPDGPSPEWKTAYVLYEVIEK